MASAWRPIAALIIVTVVAAAAPSSGSTTAPLEHVRPREAIPDFTLPDLDGRSVRLSDFRGRVVLLNVWGTWCRPCVEEMATMQELRRSYPDTDLAILALNLADDDDAVRRFVVRLGLRFVILLDDGVTALRHARRGVPSTYLLDRGGRVAVRSVGSRNWSAPDSRQAIEALLGEPGARGAPERLY